MGLNNPNVFLPIISIVVSILVVAGGFAAFKQGFFKQSSEIQGQTIDALKTRVETLESQAESDAKEIKRLRTIINTVRFALKKKGILIEIEGEYITLIENDVQSKSTRMQADDPTGKVRPIKTKLKNNSDDDDIDAS